MKKFLLSLAAVSALSASADKVAFVAANAEEFYDGDAKTIVIMPEGFYFNTPNEYTPEKVISKAICSDVVKIEATKEITGSETAAKDNKCYITSGALRWYTNQGLKFTPASGITLKKIKVRSQSYVAKNAGTSTPANYMYPITVKAEDTTFETADLEKLYLTAELNTNEPIGLKAWGGQIRAFYIELEYEGTSTQVAMPVCSASLPAVAADQEITLSSSTEGADIYYTLDGSEPSASSTKYTAPFKLAENSVVRAVAVKGEQVSFPYYGEFFVVAAGSKCAEFNLSDWETLTKKGGGKFTDADYVLSSENLPCNMSIPMDGVELVADDASLLFNGAKANIFKSWTFGYTVEYRPDDGAAFTASVGEGYELTNVVVLGSNISDPALTLVDEKGAGAYSPVNKSQYAWNADSDTGLKSVTFKSGKYIDKVYVYYKAGGSGVAAIEADENAPVEYYNLQGVRVANPEKGLYIVKQGNKVSKRIIK